MKLGELRSAIRGHKGTVMVRATLAGVTVDIPVQKTSFMSDTLEAFGESKADESGLTLSTDGVVVAENTVEEFSPADDPVDVLDTTSATSVDDDDDLFGDDSESDDDDLDDLLG